MKNNKRSRAYTGLKTLLSGIASEIKMSPEMVVAKLADKLAKEFGWDMSEFPSIRYGESEEAYHAYVTLIHTFLEMNVLKGGGLHMYLPNRDFCEWIIACVPEPKSSQLEALSFRINEHLGKSPNMSSDIILHFPIDSKLETASMRLSRTSTIDRPEETTYSMIGRFGAVDGSKIRYVGMLSTDHYLPKHFKEGYNPTEVAAENWMIRFMCGLSLYLDCFPETIKSGIPKDMAYPGYSFPQCMTISVAEQVQIKTGTHASPIGHLREGYFKTLRSERFIHKRFHTIFVHGCFVNGKAATVLAPEEIDK